MSQTLGEKLREAREERGISISEVAEQTRISSLYISSIEKDDYKPLPGGIFNKGFVKSYAKFIGLDENEALHDYAKIVTEIEGRADGELQKYRPEVLTDENTTASMVPTIIFAGIILALMTGGILFVVNYIQNQPETPELARNTAANTASTNTGESQGDVPNEGTPVPDMASLKVEFLASKGDVSLTSVTDGKRSVALVTAGKTAVFEPKESLKLSYSKSRVQFARLSINGKQIALPIGPANLIELEINKDNLGRIWESGRINFDEPQEPAVQPATEPTVEKSPQSTPAAAPTARPPTPRPVATATPRPTAAATPSPATRPRRTIVVGNATPTNRP